jgi:protein tyrosine phosphatase (PTP) superfamily phosphohydrolase (DUF442 family)
MRLCLPRGKGRWAAGTVLAAVLVAAALVFGGQAAGGTGARPETWAQPVASDAIGNWFKIDDGLYRSRQPDRAGFEEARKMGIRTVVSLRSGHSDAKLAEGLGLNLVQVPMHAWHLSAGQVLRALKAIQDGPKPVLIHCQQGADRAGVVAAAYRVVVQGWTKDEAVAELKHGGFGLHWWFPNIPVFLRRLDAAKMRAALASAAPGPETR